jgi:glutaredoxin
MSRPVVLFTRPDCPACDRAREFLAEQGLPFLERDVSADPQALAELERLGYLTTPTTKVGDEVVVGFDRQRLRQLLATWAHGHRCGELSPSDR